MRPGGRAILILLPHLVAAVESFRPTGRRLLGANAFSKGEGNKIQETKDAREWIVRSPSTSENATPVKFEVIDGKKTFLTCEPADSSCAQQIQGAAGQGIRNPKGNAIQGAPINRRYKLGKQDCIYVHTDHVPDDAQDNVFTTFSCMGYGGNPKVDEYAMTNFFFMTSAGIKTMQTKTGDVISIKFIKMVITRCTSKCQGAEVVEYGDDNFNQEIASQEHTWDCRKGSVTAMHKDKEVDSCHLEEQEAATQGV
jgi:hypothetical protein